MWSGTVNIVFRSVICVLLVGSLGGCGKPDFCSTTGQNSFSSVLEAEWRTYCTDMDRYLTQGADFDLLEVTEFFANHPQRVEEIQSKLVRFHNYDKCFDEPRQQLDLRQLKSCISEGDQAETQMNDAWAALVDESLDHLEQDQAAIEVGLQEQTKDVSRIQEKANHAWSSKSGVLKEEYVAAFRDEIRKLHTRNEANRNRLETFVQARTIAQPNQAFSSFIDEFYMARINQVKKENTHTVKTLDGLLQHLEFFEYSTVAPFRGCPSSMARGKDGKRLETLLKEILVNRIKELSETVTPLVRVTEPLRRDQQGNTMREYVGGVVCGQRPYNEKKYGDNRQCAAYQFVVERKKDVDDSQWEDWTIASFSDPGLAAGIDCRKL